MKKELKAEYKAKLEAYKLEKVAKKAKIDEEAKNEIAKLEKALEKSKDLFNM